MKKKLLTILLSFIVICSYAVPVFAMELSVTVKTSGKTITLQVEENETIENVKYKIYDEEGIAPNLQTLFYNKTELQDNRTLEDYDIQNQYTITLATPIAEIDGTKFKSLTDASETVQSGKTITLISDCDEDISLKDGVIFNIGDYSYSGHVTPHDYAQAAVIDNRGNPKRVAFYSNFNNALTNNNLQDNDTVLLLDDISYATNGSDLFNITKSITLDGDGYRISGYGSRNGNNTTLAINDGGSSIVNVTLKNLTINNAGPAGRPIETRGKIGTLTLDNVTVNATGSGNTQGLTIGGSQSTSAEIIVKSSTINAGSGGYPVITFNPVTMTIMNSIFNGYCSIYMKAPLSSIGSYGSVVTATDSTFNAPNANNYGSNDFGAFALETDDINITLTDCKINAECTGTANQTVIQENHTIKSNPEKPYSVTIDGNKTIVNGIICDGSAVSGEIFLKGGKYKLSNNKQTAQKNDGFKLNGIQDNASKIYISGGFFNINPSSNETNSNNYVASGYKVRTLDNTESEYNEGYRYEIVEKKVAKIGDTIYPSLADAIAAVPTNGTKTLITMINDETVTDTQITIDANQNIVLDLNGKIITGSCTKKPVGYSDYALLRNAGTLLIKDSASGGKITNSVTYSPGDLGGYYTVLNSGKMTLESGTIEDTSDNVGGSKNKLVWALTTVGDSDLIITGGTIVGSYNPIRIYYDTNNNGPDVTITGGELITTDRFSVIDVQIAAGGDSLAPKGNIKITGGTFYTSEQTAFGGGNVSLYVDVKPKVSVDFSGLKFSVSGGKFYSVGCTAFEEYDTWPNSPIMSGQCAHYISGGLFSYEVSATQIADGYECLINNDNTTKADYPYIVVKKIQESDLDHRETNTVTNNSGKSVDTTFGTDVIVDPTLSVTDKNKITNISVSNLNKAISSTEKNNTINAAANGLNAESNKVEVDILMNVDITTIDAIKSLSEKIESEKGSVCDINNDVEFIDISINKIVKANGSVIEASLIKTTDSYQLIAFPLIDILGEIVNPENVFVYRNHVDNEGHETNTLFTKVEASYGPNYGGECYWIDGSSLIIKAKNFSVYGIGQQSTAIPAEQAPAPTPNPSSSPKSSYVVPKTGVN